ncbi:glycosyltransferase family 2 protein [Limnoglobus roseus]|uniref:GT2 family glycosyltransferase n=1 Tax=Limnoglobus roseus TaxID=2598579 RepID=A0A5C1A2B6_9BACT|nr:glycosyltransferase family 2 protein [Limnoglobus roseus]QEL13249.1 GT2 family glycosyltransferase [Limnoglobus roseus]
MTVPPGVWVVIAAYNEGERLAVTLRGLLPVCGNVVAVDDGSRDDTAAVAATFPVWVLRHPINRGQGAALQTGLDFALARGAEVLVTFDADNQHDANDLAAVVAPVLAGTADVTLGSRFLGRTENLPASRRLVLKAGVLFTRVVSRIAVTDTHNGFRAFSAAAARRIRITQDRMAHASEILDEIRVQGLRFVEVPVTVRYSAATLAKGQSSWNAVRVVWQFLIGKVVR